LRVVVYYRSRLSEPVESENSLIEQRTAFAAWKNSHRDIETIAELTEDECRPNGRPILKAAIDQCQKSGASLVVGSTEAIGRGSPFYPRILSVPLIKLPTPNRPLGHVKPIPPDAPIGLSLHFDSHAEGLRSDVYLCNGSAEFTHDVVVHILGTTMSFSDGVYPPSEADKSAVSGDAYTTPTQIVRIETLPPGAASLITDYDALLDGDFIFVFEVSYTSKSQLQQARVSIEKNAGSTNFFRLKTIQGTGHKLTRARPQVFLRVRDKAPRRGILRNCPQPFDGHDR
jgi:hypothetical protein